MPGQVIRGIVGLTAVCRRTRDKVVMAWYLRLEERYGVRPAGLTEKTLAQARALVLVDGNAALQIRQRKGAPAVAAVGCAEQRKQRRILGYRKKLPVTKGPACRGEVKSKDSNFGDERVHEILLLSMIFRDAQFCDGNMPCKAMIQFNTRYG